MVNATELGVGIALFMAIWKIWDGTKKNALVQAEFTVHAKLMFEILNEKLGKVEADIRYLKGETK